MSKLPTPRHSDVIGMRCDLGFESSSRCSQSVGKFGNHCPRRSEKQNSKLKTKAFQHSICNIEAFDIRLEFIELKDVVLFYFNCFWNLSDFDWNLA